MPAPVSPLRGEEPMGDLPLTHGLRHGLTISHPCRGEEDGYLIGINLAESSSMLIRLKDSDINAIVYLTQAQETMYPEKDIKPEQKTLKGFIWLEDQRPKSKFDIFRKTELSTID